MREASRVAGTLSMAARFTYMWEMTIMWNCWRFECYTCGRKILRRLELGMELEQEPEHKQVAKFTRLQILFYLQLK